MQRDARPRRAVTQVVPGNDVHVAKAIEALLPLDHRVLLLAYCQPVLFESVASSEQGVEVDVSIFQPEWQPLIRVRTDGADLSDFCARRSTDLTIQIGRQAERDGVAGRIEQVDVCPSDLKRVVAV